MYRLKKHKEKIVSGVIVFLTVLLVCFGIFVGVVPSRAHSVYADEPTDRRVVGYLPVWAFSAYKNLDYDALTHINIAFCNFDNSGKITAGVSDSDINALVEKAHGSGVKVLAALGGGGYCDDYRKLISGATNIADTNAKIVAFCEKYDLDGIDLDIELDSSDGIWNNYGAWVKALRAVCDERGWLLSTATAQWVSYNVTAETFALFDYLNVMAYDDDSPGSSSHASYSFAVDCLDFYTGQKSVPARKLVLGVPFYGRGYDSSGRLDWYSYKSFAELVAADPANYYSDSYNGVAYTGANSMRQKCALARDYGGIMIWEVTLDAKGEYSLLEVIKEEILSAFAVTEPTEPSDTDTEINNGKDDTADKNNRAAIIGGIVAGSVVVAAALAAIIIIVVVRAKRKPTLPAPKE